jgi:Alpha-L-arabinofuranosidase B, catalytic
MTKTTWGVILISLALIVQAFPRGGLPGNNPTLIPAGGTCTAYLGLGDVQPGATVYVGMRAYTQALALAHVRLFQLRRASDNATQDVLSLCNGLPDDTGAGAGAFCATTTCFISEYYDQTGNGWSGLQNVNADQMGYSFSCSNANGKPCAISNINNAGYASASASLTFGQSNTFWTVEDGFNSFNASGIMVACGTDNTFATGEVMYSKNFGGINNTYVMQANGTPTFITGGVAAIGVFQDKLGVWNGTLSALYVNGSVTNGPTTTTSCTSATGTWAITGASADFLEAAAYPSDVSGNITAMRANAQAIWNY